MRNKITFFMAIAVLAGCTEIGQNSQPLFFMLEPGVTVEKTFHGRCKRITNLTEDAKAYIPTGHNTWPANGNRSDQNGRRVIEVMPCEH